MLIRISANGAQAQAELKALDKKVADFGKSAEKIGKKLSTSLTAPLTALAAVSVKLANTQQQAEAKLLNALKGRKDVQQRLIAQAGELQSRSTLGDETIIDQQAFLAALGLSEVQIGKTINAAAELSAALGISLESAVKNLAKTFGGMTGKLGESIPALKNLTKEQLMAGEAIDFVNENYKGFAATAASTGAGALVQLKNLLGDIGEMFGQIIMPYLVALAEKFKTLAERMLQMSEGWKKTILIIGGFAAAAGPAVIVFGKIVQSTSTLLAIMGPLGIAIKGLAVGPIGALIAAVTLLAGAWAMAKNHQESVLNAYKSSRERGLAERKSAIRSDLLKQYSQSSVGELEEALAYYRGVVNDDAARYISSHGGSIPERLQDELDVTTEYVRVLEELIEQRRQLDNLTSQVVNLPTPAASFEKVAGIDVDRSKLSALNFSAPTLGVEGDAGLAAKFAAKFATWENVMKVARAKAERIKELSTMLGNTLRDALTNLGVMIAEGLGKLMAGDRFTRFWEFVKMLADMITQLGSALVAFATAQIAVETALKSGNWIAALVGGIAAIAAGTALSITADKKLQVPALASGGLAYSPTLAVVGDNRSAASDPEVIAPLSKLRQYMGQPSLELTGDVEFRIDGDGLRAVLNRANTRLKYR